MNRVVDYIKNNPFKSLRYLLALAVVQVLLVFFSNFWSAFGFVFFLYFVISLYIFVLIEPREWEAGVLFFLYMLASILLMLVFASISYKYYGMLTFEGDEIVPVRVIPYRFEDHFYFSASMFTSLGFSSYLPVSDAAKFFSTGMSLLGSAHSVAFIVVMLGRARWKVAAPAIQVRSYYPADLTSRTQALEVRVARMSQLLKLVLGLLILNVLLVVFLLVR